MGVFSRGKWSAAKYFLSVGFQIGYFERILYLFEEVLRMPKQKTHKGLSKRVKITASGKVRYRRAGGGHLMSGKNAKRRRRVTSSAIMTTAAARRVKNELHKYIP